MMQTAHCAGLVLTAVFLAAHGATAFTGADAAHVPPSAASVQATSGTQEREPIWPHSVSDVPPDPAVRYGELENGMRYAVLRNSTPTHTGALMLRFDVGSLNEADDQQGLAHFLEHMAFNGSDNVPEGEMVRILERHGLAFGADTNAFTSFDQTAYSLNLPNVGPEVLDSTFLLMRELADKLTIEPAAVERERGVILSEERARDTPQMRAQVAQMKFFFPEARFPERLPIGKVALLEAAPASRIVDLYESFYRPERAFMVFVGDADPDEIEARIRKTFADWTAARPDPGNPPPGIVHSPKQAQVGYFHHPDVPAAITIAALRPAAIEPDTADGRKRMIVRGLGNEIVWRRLQALSRKADAALLGGQAGFQQVYDVADVASVSVSALPGKWKEALQVAEQELRRALDHGFTRAELDEQLARARAAYENAVERASTRETGALAKGILDAFHARQVFSHPAENLRLFEAAVNGLTAKDVHEAFREQWAGIKPLLYVLSPQLIANAQAAVLEAFEASRLVAVAPPEEARAAQFAYTDFGQPGKVIERDRVEDLRIARVRYANNVRLNFKRTDFTKDSVLVTVRAGAGALELPKELPGLNHVISGTFINGGLQAHDLDALQTLLAGRSWTLSFEVGADAFTFSGSTKPRDLRMQMQLLAAYFVAPAYRSEALERFRQQVASTYDMFDATPQGVHQNLAPPLVHSGDSRYGLPPKEQLLARTLDEVRALMTGVLGEAAIEIGVVGDIDEQTVIDAVGRTFGALPLREARPDPFEAARVVKFPAGQAEPVTLYHEGEVNHAIASTYWKTADGSDTRLERRLRLLTKVLQLKAVERIREREGATYSPRIAGDFSDIYPGFGYIGCLLDLSPDAVDRFFGVIDEIAASVAAGNISQDELDRARRPMLESFDNQIESNPYWLRLVTTAQTRPQRLDDHRTRVEGYEAITLEELKQVAAQYLHRENAYRIEILPRKRSPDAASARHADSQRADIATAM